MKVVCRICGREEELQKTHKDYQRIAADRSGVYICYRCSNMVHLQMKRMQKSPVKPL